MKKRYWFILLLFAAIIIGYFSGPVPQEPDYSEKLPDLPSDLKKLESYIKQKEDSLPVREDNEARIIWAKEEAKVTEYSLVYLHGFAGSYRDGFPVNRKIADTLNANLFLSRWAGHGLKPPASLNKFSGENAWVSAKEALMIGEKLGNKVIIMSTSTGGTLALKLAATYPEKVHALINLSPNLEDDVPGTFVLNSPWGYEIANIISFGEKKKIEHEQEIAKHYWDTIYPSRALVDLQVLVESTMIPKTYKKVQCPVLTLYYKKNIFQKDDHVEVGVYSEAHKLFSTPDSLNVLKALKTPGTHFIGSDIKSKDINIVEKEITDFLRNRMKIDLDSI
ncbi:alpha/beta hydrolase [Gramella jeungdoensis]|uniref:Alpha/beta hydrolase n=1 Tax=Gramella jeungdoensis TaxID=708091 RepID=A0ABT0Z5Q9_9FLAO|nr:alpha/beta fold hydrolase [Gramella jeungdoensis]MCM8571067.1 alpha/beta hydrolase [Gramella jeungdoensis]